MARPRSEDAETQVIEKPAEKKAETKEAKPEHPDTPSGKGLQAAEGLEGEAASEAYQEAKRKERWG